ncbi:transporter substrate-binding domain-containing protein [Aquamicrobium sp. LC103]|uniref:transporter substrate-binding domain-containing protein n=1 Tax=Aquamicrobium sp. LC103 TaxID=1120658 RepID=UPI00063ECE2B|nr:transporter substrate-binding domain-containing protein [Aquamicrobium sp. LC103]TKT74221.1 transporter substrate-binding domain-containing protein [Aquamicrobium sp. LC103]
MARKFLPALSAIMLTAAAVLAGSIAAWAQEPTIPNFWDEKERMAKPDLSQVARVRFLTTIDFPPFNYIDASGRLAGFHVELARAICAELGIVARCQIQGLPWEELEEAIERGDGEALITGTAITAENREKYAFTRPYLGFPARFVAQKAADDFREPMNAAVVGKKIGVLSGSSHEAMLRAYFPGAVVTAIEESEQLYEALRERKVDGAFGDGMRMSFWLQGSESRDCCRFVGGPYIAPEFLGYGMAIATRLDNRELAEAFDYALREIGVKGKFAELYLKYFPVSFY